MVSKKILNPRLFHLFLPQRPLSSFSSQPNHQPPPTPNRHLRLRSNTNSSLPAPKHLQLVTSGSQIWCNYSTIDHNCIKESPHTNTKVFFIKGIIGISFEFGCFMVAATLATNSKYLYISGCLSSVVVITLSLYITELIFGKSTILAKNLMAVWQVFSMSYILWHTSNIIVKFKPGEVHYVVHALEFLVNCSDLFVTLLINRIARMLFLAIAGYYMYTVSGVLLNLSIEVEKSDIESEISASVISLGCLFALVLHALASQIMVMLERLFYMGGLSASGIMTLCWLMAAHFGNLARFTQLLAGFWTIFVFLLIVCHFCVFCQRDHQARQRDEVAARQRDEAAQ